PRRRTIAGVVSACVVLVLVGLWLAGREAGPGPAVSAVIRRPSRIYPTTWPPALRGVTWLVAGVAAVVFDLIVVREGAETDRGRDFATAFAVVTGLAFFAFAVTSFLNRS